MKLSHALLWCLQALALTSAAAVDSRDLASTILGDIENAATCAGCDVRLSLNFFGVFPVATTWLSIVLAS
jgi:sphingomyelin phosphodiesterase